MTEPVKPITISTLAGGAVDEPDQLARGSRIRIATGPPASAIRKLSTARGGLRQIDNKLSQGRRVFRRKVGSGVARNLANNHLRLRARDRRAQGRARLALGAARHLDHASPRSSRSSSSSPR